jgi:4-amino-4-deoxy-L-arabinose transferase-like glycosyltransferase
LTVLLATWLLQQPALGWRVALLFAVEPLNFIYSHELMSDSFFTVLMVAAVYLSLKVLLSQDLRRPLGHAVLAGLLLGGAILTRPVGIYFPVVLIFLLLAYWWGLGQSPARSGSSTVTSPGATTLQPGGGHRNWKPLAVLAAVAILTVTPWIVRNYLTFQRILISTSADHNLLINTAAQIETALDAPGHGSSYWQVRHKLEDDLTAQMAREGLEAGNEAARAAYFRQWSVRLIKAHPFLALRFYFKGMVTQFFSDIPSFFELLGFTREHQSAWGPLIQQGLRPALAQYFGPHWPFWVAGAVPLMVYDLTVYLLTLWGIVVLWRSPSRFVLLILVSIIGYFLAVSAISGLPRYRLPVMPYFLTLAAWGWYNCATQSRSPATHRLTSA